MKMPQKPPSLDELFEGDTDRHLEILLAVSGPTHKGKYLHWDKIRRLKPPGDLTSREWWLGLKLSRMGLSKRIPLCDVDGRAFTYGLPDPAMELLHRIDQDAAGLIGMDEQITNPATRDRYIVSSLIEEAIQSSMLEGAVTTRQVAKEMIRSKRPPRDHGEQMVLNNFNAMRRIQAVKAKSLSPELVLDLHRRVTEKALDTPSPAGRLRRADEQVRVADMYNEVMHTPPPAEQLPDRLAKMCDFANGKIRGEFVHPVVRAIILHFWLAYDHPFVDGNGRCARALFYWSMLRQGYWLCEFISISQMITKAPVRYSQTFLYTETDDNDLTYFLLYHLDIISKAIKELHKYITRKTDELRTVERRLRATVHLNHRQQALISHALRQPDARYSISSHRLSHGVVYETARSDLFDLEAKELLVAGKIGRTWYFRPAENLEKRLSELG